MAVQYICLEPVQNGDSYSCKSLIAQDTGVSNGLAITQEDALVIGGWLLTVFVCLLGYVMIVKAIKVA